MKDPKELLETIDPSRPLFIQTHDFPDHDAVASAFSLQVLLKAHNMESHLVYEGKILRDSVMHMIEHLSIPLLHASTFGLSENDQIIIVDGCKGNSNVTDLIGEEIAVIDHHSSPMLEKVPYMDVRPDYGSCSTIIATYFKELGVKIPSQVATAMMIGINIDTLHLTRSVTAKDIQIYAELHVIADNSFVTRLVTNDISLQDLPEFDFLIKHIRLHNRLAFCYFPNGCSRNLLAILSAFMITLQEIDITVTCAKNEDQIDVSVKSLSDDVSALHLILLALKGIGRGGGHPDMAGGSITRCEGLNEDKLFDRFKKYVNVLRVNYGSQVGILNEDEKKLAIDLTLRSE